MGSLFSEYLPETKARELCAHELLLDPIFRRTVFRRIGKQSWEQIAQKMEDKLQVLCIVNSRKGAQEIFSRLQGEGCFHLSTLMYPAHRERVLTEIRRRLKEDLPCRVISTSLIEAGVDVDFPEVYREQAGIDSILQAAGRCNREGKRPLGNSIVTVFQTEMAPPPIFSVPISAGRYVMEKFEDIESPEAISTYFQELLTLKGNKAQDVEQILPLMQQELFPFQKVADRFRMIDSETRTVYIPQEDGVALIERLRSGEHSRSLFRQLGRYSVAVYQNQFDALNGIGVLEILEDGSAVLRNLQQYDNFMGLSPDTDGGKALFI